MSPKRVLDGEAMWGSEKLKRLPEQVRVHYAWLLPLAMANGVFECDARLIWSRCYSYGLDHFSVQDVERLLNQLEEHELLIRWQAQGKTWGYWVGIDKPGRLPPVSRRGFHEIVGPDPPEELLRKVGCQKPEVSPLYERRINRGDISGFIYFLLAEESNRVKIGYSIDPNLRLDTLQTGCPDELKLLKLVPGTQEQETECHKKWSGLRVRGEWFHASKPLLDWIDSITDTNGFIGLGLGSGLGLGLGSGEEARAASSALHFSGRHVRITEEQHGRLSAAFPGVDVQRCYEACDLWQDANPARRKTNQYAAMLNWLKREVPGGSNGKHSEASAGRGPECDTASRIRMLRGLVSKRERQIAEGSTNPRIHEDLRLYKRNLAELEAREEPH